MTRRRVALDAGLALGVLGMSLAMLRGGGFGDPSPHAHPLDAAGVVLAMATALPLAARRVAPLSVFAVAAAGSLSLHALGYPFDVPFGPVIAVYTLGLCCGGDPRRARRLTAMLAAYLFVPLTAAAYAVSGLRLDGIMPELLLWALGVAGVWITGDRTRLRRERISELEDQARRRNRDADRERRLAAATERTRIARELHDSAGHAINVILVQAGAARLLHGRDREGSLRAIATIEEVALRTIGEIDQLVHALREEGQGGSPVPADPAALEELVERHRAGGLSIVTDLRGPRRELPRSVAWAAYRILQEALTNAARHGRGTADVAVRFGPDAVRITVTNPVASGEPVSPGGGHGILGMRERASLLGGTLEARAEVGRFSLRAWLPYSEAAT